MRLKELDDYVGKQMFLIFGNWKFNESLLRVKINTEFTILFSYFNNRLETCIRKKQAKYRSHIE